MRPSTGILTENVLLQETLYKSLQPAINLVVDKVCLRSFFLHVDSSYILQSFLFSVFCFFYLKLAEFRCPDNDLYYGSETSTNHTQTSGTSAPEINTVLMMMKYAIKLKACSPHCIGLGLILLDRFLSKPRAEGETHKFPRFSCAAQCSRFHVKAVECPVHFDLLSRKRLHTLLSTAFLVAIKSHDDIQYRSLPCSF